MDFSQYDYNLEEIKENLTTEQVFDILGELGAEPRIQGNMILNKTICHCGESHKLYYYDNSHLFKCYTDCGTSFDLFELVRKVKERESGEEYPLPFAVKYVAQYFGYAPKDNNAFKESLIRQDLIYLQNFDRINNIEVQTQEIELKEYDGSFLKNLPQPIIGPWIRDGISKETMDYFDIRYDPKNNGIVIPHYDINGRLVGIRERTMVEENEEKHGKYLPMKMGKQMYNHPLSFCLYGLYQNKENIKKIKKAIVLEGEKSVLQLDSILGRDSNIGVACCGSSFISYQAKLLIDLGVEEIIVGLDRQFKELNDKEHEKLVKNLRNIHYKYGKYIKISYLFDKEMVTPYKASPTDCGKDIFWYLYNKRVNLY